MKQSSSQSFGDCNNRMVIKKPMKTGILVLSIVLLLVAIFTSCSPSDQFKHAYEDLKSGKSIYATALLTSGNSEYSSETIYAQGNDSLRIANGPEDSWQHVVLFLDGNYYSGTRPDQNVPSGENIALSYNSSISKPDSVAPWCTLQWDDIKDTIVSIEENKGTIKVYCEDPQFTTVYELNNGQIISIAYTEIISYFDPENKAAEAAFTNTYTFHQISQQEVDAVFSEYLAKVQK